MYIACDWPSNFDRIAFQSSYDQFQEDKIARYRAEEPLEMVRMLEEWIEGPKLKIAWLKKKLRELNPDSEDGEDVRRIAQLKVDLERFTLELIPENTE